MYNFPFYDGLPRIALYFSTAKNKKNYEWKGHFSNRNIMQM